MGIQMGDAQDGYNWLTNENWIAFNDNDDGFSNYLETNYFKPGTPKNAEFEVMITPVEHQGQRVMSFWFRIKDTPENRNSLNAALAEFYNRALMTSKDLDTELQRIRGQLHLNATLRDERLVIHKGWIVYP